MMDRDYVENEHIVERYLSGELTVLEAREFEEYCLEHPQALREMPIPVRLKARLAKRPPEDSETGIFQAIPSSATRAAVAVSDEGFDAEEEARWRSRGGERPGRWLVTGLLVALVAAIGGTVIYGLEARALNGKLRSAQREIQTLGMQAPGSVQNYKLKLARNKPQQATLAPGWLQPPQMLELHVDAGEGKYNAYQVTIDKADGTRVMQIHRLARDSNRELRVALNSSAFGPGQYLLKFEGYTWRGQLEEVGWIRLGLD
jgi:hypothetical protein